MKINAWESRWKQIVGPGHYSSLQLRTSKNFQKEIVILLRDFFFLQNNL